ncbi:hypothetical protein B0T26DRAFT_470016 [Lasiosphaeria miniovina]|uniref:Uncharacterized protein n=1 Tax=Lasiosphaeria miniovina TaxID=1954250 RepID=A0AA39ZZY4_9PEZI|nr:uncharacterized protein B0T26DRAFT_470016 [Lasiosphaeria miniovina]KAK0706738.1 hypothetical protein B0T26DRAFT_470016 [Lasiosphaeria miniovina]
MGMGMDFVCFNIVAGAQELDGLHTRQVAKKGCLIEIRPGRSRTDLAGSAAFGCGATAEHTTGDRTAEPRGATAPIDSPLTKTSGLPWGADLHGVSVRELVSEHKDGDRRDRLFASTAPSKLFHGREASSRNERCQPTDMTVLVQMIMLNKQGFRVGVYWSGNSPLHWAM